MRPLRDLLAGWLGWIAPPPDAPPRPTHADAGIAYRSVDELLAPHGDLLARIKLSYGADAAAFERELLPLIRRYAEHVHLLPATADSFFGANGGLLGLGLETAFFALQATDGQIFSGGSTITSRRELEPRWRLATFIAGLCHEIHRSFTRVVATDARGECWPAYLLPLDQWLRERRADRFFVRWLPQADDARSVALFALPRIVPQPVLQHLAEANTTVVPHLLASIAGLPVWHDDNVLDRLVRRAAALVIDRDLRAAAERSGTAQPGSHLGRYLVDAMRCLVRDHPAWQPNADKARLWLGADGAFIVWPNAANDVIKALEAEQLPGMPKTPEAVLDVLLAERIVIAGTPDAPTWPIKPPGARLPIDAVRLASADIVFAGSSGAPPRPLAFALCSAPPAAGARAPAEQRPAPAAPPTRAQAVDVPPAAQAAIPLDSAAPREPQGQAIVLHAPFKLDPLVAAALADIVGTLNRGGGGSSAAMTPLGVFVPLAEFERRQLDPGAAVRALADCDMLGCPGAKSKTIVMNWGAGKARGIVLALRFIAGLEAPAAETATTDT